MAIKIFYHICAINQVISIVKEFINAVHFSGLYDEVEGIYCYISGQVFWGQQVIELLSRSGCKFKIQKFVPEDTTMERLTLCDIHNHVDDTDLILYLHSKGNSNHHQTNHYKLQCISDWRYMMIYYLIGKYQQCIKHLQQGIDTVGCNLKTEPSLHFSGNFWWVRGSYFLTLPHTIGPDYFDSELNFLFLNQPSYYSIHDSNKEQYSMLYSPSRYIDNTAVQQQTISESSQNTQN